MRRCVGETTEIIKLQMCQKSCSSHTHPVHKLPGWLTFRFPGTPVSWWATGHRGGSIEGVLHQDSPFQAKVTCWSQFSRRPRKEGKCTDLGTVEWGPDPTWPKATGQRAQLCSYPLFSQCMPKLPEHDKLKFLPTAQHGPCWDLSSFHSNGGYTSLTSSSTKSTS